MVSYVDGVGIRTIKPVGGKVAFATFDIDAHKVDAVEANVEPSAVGRDDLWPEGGLVFVLGEAREYRADLNDVGDDDAVAEGMLLKTYLAHVSVDGLEDAKETFQQTGGDFRSSTSRVDGAGVYKENGIGRLERRRMKRRKSHENQRVSCPDACCFFSVSHLPPFSSTDLTFGASADILTSCHQTRKKRSESLLQSGINFDR